MNLEPVKQSELGQKEENKYCILTHMYTWNLEKWCWGTCLQDRNGDADLEKRPVDPVGEGAGGADWESSAETYRLPYVK